MPEHINFDKPILTAAEVAKIIDPIEKAMAGILVSINHLQVRHEQVQIFNNRGSKSTIPDFEIINTRVPNPRKAYVEVYRGIAESARKARQLRIMTAHKLPYIQLTAKQVEKMTNNRTRI